MDRRPSANRRLERSSRVTTAVALLVVASAGVVGAVWIRERWFLVGACLLAVGCGWTALRLTWTVVLATRQQNAHERSELARTYRELFSARAVEHHGFVSGMSQRLAARDRLVRELEGSLTTVSMRAIEAETSAKRFRLRLDDAESRLVALEDLLDVAGVAGVHDEPDAVAGVAGVADGGDDAAHPETEDGIDDQDDVELTMPLVLPEWAELEGDPTAALLAWEQHATTVSGPRSADATSRAG